MTALLISLTPSLRIWTCTAMIDMSEIPFYLLSLQAQSLVWSYYPSLLTGWEERSWLLQLSTWPAWEPSVYLWVITVLVIGAEAKILAMLYIGQILMGFGGYSLSMVSYSYLSEINNDVWRQKSLVLTYAFWYRIFYIGHWEKLCFSQSFDGFITGVIS